MHLLLRLTPLLIFVIQTIPARSDPSTGGAENFCKSMTDEIERLNTFREKLKEEAKAKFPLERENTAIYKVRDKQYTKLRQKLWKAGKAVFEDSFDKALKLNPEESKICLKPYAKFFKFHMNRSFRYGGFAIAHLCKNNLAAKFEKLFGLEVKLDSFDDQKSPKCNCPKDQKCAKKALGEMKRLSDGEFGIFSPKFKDFYLDGFKFLFDPKSDCMATFSQGNNSMIDTLLSRAKAVDDCLKKIKSPAKDYCTLINEKSDELDDHLSTLEREASVKYSTYGERFLVFLTRGQSFYKLREKFIEKGQPIFTKSLAKVKRLGTTGYKACLKPYTKFFETFMSQSIIEGATAMAHICQNNDTLPDSVMKQDKLFGLLGEFNQIKNVKMEKCDCPKDEKCAKDVFEELVQLSDPESGLLSSKFKEFFFNGFNLLSGPSFRCPMSTDDNFIVRGAMESAKAADDCLRQMIKT